MREIEFEDIFLGTLIMIMGFIGWIFSGCAIADIGSDYTIFPDTFSFVLRIIYVLSMIVMMVGLSVLIISGIIIIINMVTSKEIDKKKKKIAVFATILLLFITIFAIYFVNKPKEVCVTGTITGISHGVDTALIAIKTADNKSEIFECYLTWGIIKDLRVGKTYQLYFVKSKSDELYRLIDYKEIKEDKNAK